MDTNTKKRRRLLTVTVAPAAALATWGIEKALGADLLLKNGTSVHASDLVLAAVSGSVAAWLVARWIERHSHRPRSVWAFAASAALSVSLIGPSWLADGVAALLLFALHVVTAAVLIVGLTATLPLRGHVPVNER